MADPAVTSWREQLPTVGFLAPALRAFRSALSRRALVEIICPRQVRLVLAAAVLLAAVPGAAQAAQDEPVVVAAANIAYEPQTLTTVAGTTVTWINQDEVQHTVTADDGAFDSGLFGRDEVFSYTFESAGTYAYYCIPHGAPGSIGMAGVLVVVDAE
jgi:plastocyanin